MPNPNLERQDGAASGGLQPSADRFAFLIGSFAYDREPKLASLRGPANDIAALKEVLSAADIGGFITDTSINKSSATLLEQIDDFLSVRRPEDVVLLYFSGHGVKDADGRLYFATSNTKLDRLPSTALRAPDINDMLHRCRARQKMLVLDCCYSGAFARGMQVRSGDNVCISDFFPGRGHAVLTASNALQYALEEELIRPCGQGIAQSIFTSALVEGLRSGAADSNGDGVVTFDELYEFVHECVHTRTPNQTPSKWSLDQQGQLVVARVSPDKLKPVSLPRDLSDAVTHSLTWVRKSALEQLLPWLKGEHRGRALAAREALERLCKDNSDVVKQQALQLLQRAGGGSPGSASQGTPAAAIDTRPSRSTDPTVVPNPMPRPKSSSSLRRILMCCAAIIGVACGAWIGLGGSAIFGTREPFATKHVFRDDLRDGGEGPLMIVIPAGEFTMGARDGDSRLDEAPPHKVTVSAFALGQSEVTFDDYDRFARATGRQLPPDAGWGRGTRPVINVSWHDARAYARWLSEQSGREYRLPSESEWEYAARAGTKTPFHTGNCLMTTQAAFDGRERVIDGCPNSDKHLEGTQPVASYAANDFGIFDMHGNVWEWVEDCYHSNYHRAPVDGKPWLEASEVCSKVVMRGGAWDEDARWARATARGEPDPDKTSLRVGFRLVRALQQPSAGSRMDTSATAAILKVPPVSRGRRPFRADRAFRHALQSGDQGPLMIVIAAGEFLMGSPDTEIDRNEIEGPQHRVTIQSFAMSQTEVTFDDYDRFARATQRPLPEDKGWGRGRRPVINVNWHDARAYAQWLSAQTGHRYRLPSEAEWEYAARAGTDTPFNMGFCLTTIQANFNSYSVAHDSCVLSGVLPHKTTLVGSYGANAFGLFDMHGNVWEWVEDCYSNVNYDKSSAKEADTGSCESRGTRGGGWTNVLKYQRSAFRGGKSAKAVADDMGFRLAMSLPSGTVMSAGPSSARLALAGSQHLARNSTRTRGDSKNAAAAVHPGAVGKEHLRPSGLRGKGT